MSTATELLKLALEWIEYDLELVEDIRTFLAAEPEAEPVAWMREDGEIGNYNPSDYGYGTKVFPLYLHPPKPEPARKPMTHEEIIQGVTVDTSDDFHAGYWAGIRFAEKHHGIGRGME